MGDPMLPDRPTRYPAAARESFTPHSPSPPLHLACSPSTSPPPSALRPFLTPPARPQDSYCAGGAAPPVPCPYGTAALPGAASAVSDCQVPPPPPHSTGPCTLDPPASVCAAHRPVTPPCLACSTAPLFPAAGILALRTASPPTFPPSLSSSLPRRETPPESPLPPPAPRLPAPAAFLPRAGATGLLRHCRRGGDGVSGRLLLPGRSRGGAAVPALHHQPARRGSSDRVPGAAPASPSTTTPMACPP
jgi:hypothetical protein